LELDNKHPTETLGLTSVERIPLQKIVGDNAVHCAIAAAAAAATVQSILLSKPKPTDETQ
jgi:hypothetical protein